MSNSQLISIEQMAQDQAYDNHWLSKQTFLEYIAEPSKIVVACAYFKKSYLTQEQLSKLSVQRLKGLRNSIRAYQSMPCCECCGEPLDQLYPDDYYHMEERVAMRAYEFMIKLILDTKPHVSNNRKDKKSQINSKRAKQRRK